MQRKFLTILYIIRIKLLQAGFNQTEPATFPKFVALGFLNGFFFLYFTKIGIHVFQQMLNTNTLITKGKNLTAYKTTTLNKLKNLVWYGYQYTIYTSSCGCIRCLLKECSQSFFQQYQYMLKYHQHKVVKPWWELKRNKTCLY